MSLENLRSLLRLVGECREIVNAGESAAGHLLRGLAHVTNSQVAIDMAATVRPGSAPVMTAVQDIGWATESDRDRIYEYVKTTPIEDDPLAHAAFEREELITTVIRGDVDTMTRWSRSEYRNDIHRPAGVDDALLSIMKMRGHSTARGIVLKRAWGERPYGAEERDLVDCVHRECSWVFDPPSPKLTHNASLTPRERETLDGLLRGESEKCIAASLGLSPHTVHDYVKTLYRKLGITSRGELMALVLERRAPRTFVRRDH